MVWLVISHSLNLENTGMLASRFWKYSGLYHYDIPRTGAGAGVAWTASAGISAATSLDTSILKVK